MAVIPFYGTDRPDLFAIERKAMDRRGLVAAALERVLPGRGRVLDVGAGNGFTALGLASPQRVIVPLEPADGMIDRRRRLPWVRADAERLPFAAGAFSAAYATWAYFFPRLSDPAPGLAELHRVVSDGGPLAIVDNLGGDEFCALAATDITTDREYWERMGFRCTVIDTSFVFDDLDEARRLLAFYFGEAGVAGAAVEIGFRVGLFVVPSGGHQHHGP